MSSLLSQLIIILLLVVGVLVILVVLGVINPKNFNTRNDKPWTKKEVDSEKTQLPPGWKLELADEDGNVLKEQEIPGLRGNERFTVGREGKNAPDFAIPDSNNYLSREIGEVIIDGGKYVFRANKNASDNSKVYYHGKPCEQVLLKDGLVVNIGNSIPLRFVKISISDLIVEGLANNFENANVDATIDIETVADKSINHRF